VRARSVAAMAIGAVTLTSATALPAAANDVDLAVGYPGQTVKPHHGLWDDSHDNLGACLGGMGTYTKAIARIRPADGTGPTFSIDDLSYANGCEWTGNLSIPEDERYIMTLTVYNRDPANNLSDSVAFYT
jgi:hypothetical protein